MRRFVALANALLKNLRPRTLREAQAHATAQVAGAEGQATANTKVTATLSPSILQQLAIQRWNGVLPTYLGAGAPMPFLNTGQH